MRVYKFLLWCVLVSDVLFEVDEIDIDMINSFSYLKIIFVLCNCFLQ